MFVKKFDKYRLECKNCCEIFFDRNDIFVRNPNPEDGNSEYVALDFWYKRIVTISKDFVDCPVGITVTKGSSWDEDIWTGVNYCGYVKCPECNTYYPVLSISIKSPDGRDLREIIKNDKTLEQLKQEQLVEVSETKLLKQNDITYTYNPSGYWFTTMYKYTVKDKD